MEDNYQPDWDAYFCLIDDRPASIATDLDLRRFAPLADKQYMVQISVRVQDPDENGLPKGHELETLSAIEDALSFELGSQLEAVFVGRSAFHGLRSFYFYVETIDHVAAVVINQISEFEGYSAELEICAEPEWETYFEFLLPDEREFQRIQNRRLLAQLEEYGDDSETPRTIEHVVFFPTDEDRSRFIKNAVIKGFEPTDVKEDQDDELPFSVRLAREDCTTEENIDQTVLFLWELALENKGEYDGWETVVVGK